MITSRKTNYFKNQATDLEYADLINNVRVNAAQWVRVRFLA